MISDWLTGEVTKDIRVERDFLFGSEALLIGVICERLSVRASILWCKRRHEVRKVSMKVLIQT